MDELIQCLGFASKQAWETMAGGAEETKLDVS